jgi:hypothetical protein
VKQTLLNLKEEIDYSVIVEELSISLSSMDNYPEKKSTNI